MCDYICEKCGKEFKQKSSYTRHINRKNPCVIVDKKSEEDEVDKTIKEIVDVDKKSEEFETLKLDELKIIDEDNNIYDNKLVKNITYKKIIIPKPILKWVGGKTNILDKLIIEFPININNYREIFLGGGSVLLALLSYVKNGIIKIHGNIYAYDLNEELIYVYKNIQSNHDNFYNQIQLLISDFNSCGDGEINRNPINIDEAKESKENYYYWIRREYNNLSCDDKKTIIGSAMFVFLNKTCFRGVFRIGPKGFNVPYGNYINPEIINKIHLDEIHDLIQNVIFECLDFTKSLNFIEPNDYLYLDPPYAPETDTSFVNYTKKGFTIKDNNSLFKIIHKLSETNKKILLSNADVKLVRDSFTNEKYNIESILCRRAINSKNPQLKTKEVIIKNY